MNKLVKAVLWVSDFLRRVFGSTYEVQGFEVKSDGKIPTFDFRKWPNEKERDNVGPVFTLETDSSGGVKANRRQLYGEHWYSDGIFTDKIGNKFPIPARLYDFVFWRHVLFTLTLGVFLFLTIFSWHGGKNIFVDDAWTNETSITTTLSAHLGEGGVASKRYNSYEILVFFVLFAIPAIARTIWCTEKYHRYDDSTVVVYTIICVLFITVIVISAPVHYRFAEGQVVPKSEGIKILNKRLVDIYDSYMENGEYEKASQLATKRRNGKVSRAEWHIRNMNSALVIVEKNPLLLDEYVDTLRLTKEFFPLYLRYLRTETPILAKMHCKDDPWMMYSSSTHMDEKSLIDQICAGRAEEMNKAIKKELKRTK